MEEQHSNDGFRERISGLAIACTIIAGIALGLQVAGVATNYWILADPVQGVTYSAGLWKECSCFQYMDPTCSCNAVIVGFTWLQMFAVTVTIGMAMTLLQEFYNIRQEQTLKRNVSRFISKGITLICALILLILFGVGEDGYYNWTSSAIYRLGYSFILCAVAAGLIVVDVLIGIVDICRRRPTSDDVIARRRARRDRASVRRHNDMAIEHRESVQQQLPNYNYVDRQRWDMRQNDMSLEHHRSVQRQLPNYNYVDTQRFDMRRY